MVSGRTLGVPTSPHTTRTMDPPPPPHPQGDREVTISLDIEFPALKCADAGLRVEDSKGVPYDDAAIHIARAPITADGEQAPNEASGVGCRMEGTMKVKRVGGNFHIAPSARLTPQMMMGGGFAFPPPPGASK